MLKLLSVISASIAALAIALPAFAYEYTSSPIAPDDTRDLDTTPVLMREAEQGKVYASRGYWSSLAHDGNLYVSRIFVNNFDFRGSPVTMTTFTQIDCGRRQSRDLLTNLEVNGIERRVDSRDWTQFSTVSVMGETCEAAASDRGITWNWDSN